MDGKLTILALSHFGPENSRIVPDHNGAFRYSNDVTAVWKINDNLTSTTDVNYIHDDFFNASGYGVAQYLTYQLTEQVSYGGRLEVWRDDKGFFVGAFPSSLDFVNAERGLDSPNVVSVGAATYSALTLGVNWKPAIPGPLGLLVRPELRYDQTLSGTRAFNDGRSTHQFTVAIDAILSF
jgi:hypothetical protein